MTNEEAIKELECMKRHTIDFLEIDVFDKAIEALRRHDVPDTNVGDMISRQAAIDAVEFGITYAKAFDTKTGEMTELYLHVKESNEELRKAVKRLRELPPAQPEQNWIPCSERLPNDDEEVIVSILDDSGDTSFSYTTPGWHYKGIWIVDNSRCPMVKAWMPLPEPYREVEHD